jgi:hypothetical protein
MRSSTGIAYTALVIVESVWWFAVLATIGGMVGLGGSPLPWAAVLMLFAVGMSSAWLFGGMDGDSATIALYQGVVALIAVYLAMANVTVAESWSFEIAWPVDTFGGTFGNEGVADVIIGVIAAGWIWYRSQSLVVGGGLDGKLARAFKLGTVFISIGLLVEYSAIRSDIGIAALLLPFFGAALVGMAVTRLPQSDDAGKASWPKIIGVSVGAILGLGAVGGVLTGRYGDLGVRGLINAWGGFVDALLWVLRYPLEWIITLLWRLLLWLRDRARGEEEEQVEQEPPGPLSEDMVNPGMEQAERATDFAMEAIRWPVSILLLVVLFFVLVFAYRRFSTRKSDKDNADRESIRGDADAGADMMKLLAGLMPSWMKGRKRRSLWKWPEGERGVAEAFLLYFDTLTHAIKRGMTFDPNATPNERVTTLAVYLPGAPVETVTSRFNAACYGAVPADTAEIDRLRVAIEEASKKPKPKDVDEG